MPATDFPQECQAFRDYYNDQIRVLHEGAAFFQSLVFALLRQHPTIEIDAVTSRVKDREECVRKFQYKYRDTLEAQDTKYEIKDWITDLVGVRVVCLYEPDVYAVEHLLKDHFEVVDESDKKKAMEQMEDSFGYKGVHLDLKLGKGREGLVEYRPYQHLQFEAQIRTISQDAWSTLDHKIKYKKIIPIPLKRRINRLAALFELADQEFVNIRDAAQTELVRGAQVAADLQQELASTRSLARSSIESSTQGEPLASLTASDSKSPDGEANIDVFGFIGVARQHFGTYPFLADRSDAFVQEILRLKNSLSAAELAQILDANIGIVQEFRQMARLAMNPFTVIRHALFAASPTVYSSLLFPNQRGYFEAWLTSRQDAARTPSQSPAEAPEARLMAAVAQ